MAISNGPEKHVFCGKCGSKNVVLRDQAERVAARRILERRAAYNDSWVPITILFAFIASMCTAVFIVAKADEVVALFRPLLNLELILYPIVFMIVCLVPSAISVLVIALGRIESRSPATLQAIKEYNAVQAKPRDHYDLHFPFACKEYGHLFDHTRAELQDVKELKSFLVLEKYREPTATGHTSVDDDRDGWPRGNYSTLLAQIERDEKRYYQEQKARDMEWRENFRDKNGRDPNFLEGFFHDH